jgi:gliding motility-associated-like protein
LVAPKAKVLMLNLIHNLFLLKTYRLSVLLFALIVLAGLGAQAQAPNISYQSPQVYTVNTAITPISPKNTGGTVPKNAYGGVTTLAGTGSAGSVDGPGTSAQFNAPRGLSCDAQGNIYVADRSNNKIREVTPAGIVLTVAGSGVAGAANLQGTSATFTGPNGLVAAQDGTIYIADSGNQMIRKIATNGVVSTVAGIGIAGNADGKQFASFNFPNDVVINNIGELYISDYANEEIRKIGLDGVVHTVAGTPNIGNQDGTGPAARFYNPGGMTTDKTGDVIICDVNNNNIREMLPDSIVNTIAGNGTKGFSNGPTNSCMFNYPAGVAIDVLGNTYVSDTFNYLIRKIDPLGNVTTLCGLQGVSGFTDGQREAATFNETFGIATDNKGNLFVSDGGNNSIRQVSLTGYEIDKPLPPGLNFDETTGAISGTPTAPSPSTTYTITAYNLQGSSSTTINITVNNASLAGLIAPNISYQTPQVYAINNAISPLSPTNTGGAVPPNTYAQVTTLAGSGQQGSQDGTGKGASFDHPIRSVEDAAGNLYVADRDNGSVRKVTPAGVVTTYATSFNQPNGITIDASGNFYVTEAASNDIKELKPNGTTTVFAGGTLGSADGTGTNASFYYPYGITIDAAGNLYVADSQNNKIRKITPGQVVTTLAGSGNAAFADGTGAQASFNKVDNVFFDNGILYTGDTFNNRIRQITLSGVVTTIAGTGASGHQDGPAASATFTNPGTTASDAAGNIYVADAGNFVIRKIDKTGTVSTLAGNGVFGNTDGIGIAASFGNFYGLNVDPLGFMYITDFGNSEIRKISLTGYIIDKPLPPGLTFDPTTGIITGTPTAASADAVYTITAYNLAGNSSFPVHISVITAVSLAAIQTKTICDADFALTVSGGTGTYTYTSSNINVATVNAGMVHITGPGTCTITVTDGYSSQQQTFTVSQPIIPTITIDPSVYDGCDGMSLTYMAKVTNAGTAPTYQWEVNGQPVGTNSNSFTSSTLNNGDIINCILTNTTDCTSGPVTSANASAILSAYQTPAVTIASSATGPVTPGANVIFTATPTNGGTNPAYQWYLNGNEVGTNSPTYSSACFSDGDAVMCVMTNQGGKCLTILTAVSNTIFVSTTMGNQFVSISASATTIYSGQSVTFTAKGVSLGTSPAYQWQLNGANVGDNSSTYTSNTLKNGDVVVCLITNNGCNAPLTTNSIIITVLPSANVVIPTAFTPNGDGINDQWNIEALASYPNCVVDVFTRYGTMIFHSRGYSQPWDGTLKGSKLAPGTYYYVIDLGNNSPKLSGYVALIR